MAIRISISDILISYGSRPVAAEFTNFIRGSLIGPLFFCMKKSTLTFLFPLIGMLSCFAQNNSPASLLSGIFANSWATYVGASDTDELHCVRDMPDGGVVVCGTTMSTDFPGMDSLDSAAGNYDMVIFRMDSSGQLLWTTLFGGQYFESANCMVVHDTSIYVVGVTNGNDMPLINAYQSTTGGSYDAVILRIGFDGTVQQSSYFGSIGGEQAFGIDVDQTGKIVIGGSTTSPTLPMSAGNYQPGNGGANDCFITVLNDSFAPIWTTFYGGTGTEDVHQLAITPLNKIALIGASFSSNFPCTPNAFQPGRMGFCDAYLLVFDMNGNREVATYYGGSGNEDCYGIAGDSAGNYYVSGHTSSIDFNTTGTIFQPNYAGVNDAWITRFDSTGQPVFSTYFGGAGDDKVWNMQLHDGYLYVSGVTGSSDLPMNTNVPQDSMWGATDGFIVKIDTAGNYVTSSFLGGSGADDAMFITINSDTVATVVGTTYSNNFPVSAGCYQPNYVSNGDGFVARYKISEEWSSNAVFTHSMTENSIGLFPNPATDAFNIQSTITVTRIEMVNAQGEVLSANEFDSMHECSVDISGLPVGVYFARIYTSDSRVQTQKMIKAE